MSEQSFSMEFAWQLIALMLTVVHSIFYGKCLGYLDNLVSHIDCGRPHHSLQLSLLVDFSLPWLHSKFSEHAFVYASLSVWNTLPNDLHAVTDPGLFRKKLARLMSVDDVNYYVRHLCPIIVIGAL